MSTLRWLGCEIIGTTPSRQPWAPDRPREIIDWLRSYNAAAERFGRPPVSEFVAVDDRPLLQENGGDELQGHFVWTDPRVDLTDDDAQRIVAALHPDQPVKPWPGGHVLLTRAWAKITSPADEPSWKYSCAVAGSGSAKPPTRPSPWIVVDDEAEAAPRPGSAVGGSWRHRLFSMLVQKQRAEEPELNGRQSDAVNVHGASVHGDPRASRAKQEAAREAARSQGRHAASMHGGSYFAQGSSLSPAVNRAASQPGKAQAAVRFGPLASSWSAGPRWQARV